MMGHAMGLQGVEALEIEQGLQQPRASRITVKHRKAIRRHAVCKRWVQIQNIHKLCKKTVVIKNRTRQTAGNPACNSLCKRLMRQHGLLHQARYSLILLDGC